MSRAGRRRVPSGVPGISWVTPSRDPAPALTLTFADAEITIDQYEVAASTTLLALWVTDGLLRLPAAGWRLAREDVAYAHEWRLHLDLDGPRDRVALILRDTRTTDPARVALVSDDPHGRARVDYLTAPAAGISGDADTDLHIAIMLCLIRHHGGTLTLPASSLAATARVLRAGHRWRAIPGTGSEDEQCIYLAQPDGPPPTPWRHEC